MAAKAPRCGSRRISRFFSGGAQYAGGTLSYLRGLAQVNRVLAARADAVAEIVCSRVNPLKGGDLLCL